MKAETLEQLSTLKGSSVRVLPVRIPPRTHNGVVYPARVDEGFRGTIKDFHIDGRRVSVAVVSEGSRSLRVVEARRILSVAKVLGLSPAPQPRRTK